MKIGDNLFVYGTLRPGQSRSPVLAGKVRYLGPATLEHAVLYNVSGMYPGLKMVTDANKTVVGDLYEVTDSTLPARLDVIEGYPYLYDRRLVTFADGTLAWTYTLNQDMPDESIIKSGDWCNRGDP